MLAVKASSETTARALVGPNCPGVITPGECKIGIMPGDIHLPGKVGIVSRSGTLTYEAVKQTTDRASVRAPAWGLAAIRFPAATSSTSRAVRGRPGTEAIVMVGEIGGTAEEEAAEYIKANVTKPVVGYIAGVTAPPGKRMGHAGAIIAGGKGTAARQVRGLRGRRGDAPCKAWPRSVTRWRRLPAGLDEMPHR